MLELKQIESFYPENLKVFKRNLLREYLQYKILEVVFASEFGRSLVFMGGTAVHIVHGLPRFSEDLDFDNIGLDKAGFHKFAIVIQKKLKLQGCNAQIKTSYTGAYRIFIRITDILYENKLSAHKQEKLLIQLDAEGQKFSYAPEKVILNKFDVFTRVSIVPLDILLSQKLYAIFMRKRPMGRDFFDAIFLFGKTMPNYEYLKLKLKIDSLSDLKKKILKHCRGLNFKLLARDVEGFLFIPEDAKKVELFREYIADMK